MRNILKLFMCAAFGLALAPVAKGEVWGEEKRKFCEKLASGEIHRNTADQEKELLRKAQEGVEAELAMNKCPPINSRPLPPNTSRACKQLTDRYDEYSRKLSKFNCMTRSR